MRALVKILGVLSSLAVSEASSVNYMHDEIVTKIKVPLTPVHIKCSLNEIIVIASPIVSCQDTQYRLQKPNGDVIGTIIPKQKSEFSFHADKDDIYRQDRSVIKYINKNIKAAYPLQLYRAVNLISDEDFGSDVISNEEKKMNKNDFMVGPLLEEDHGNWVLSIYCTDIDGQWVEMFQVITIEITTSVRMEPPMATLPEGSTFTLGFLYPIKGLETCELTVPNSSVDRFFNRNPIDLDKCGYVVPNITKADEGTWRVIGVGKVVYEGLVSLTVGLEDDNSVYVS